MINTALATYVAARAWRYLPARLFFMAVLLLVALQVGRLIRISTDDLGTAYQGGALESISISGLSLVMLLLFSALFLPSWWERSRPIRWLILPNVITFIILAAALAMRSEWLIGQMQATSVGYRFVVTSPAAAVTLLVQVLSWLPHLGILIVAYARKRGLRPLIAGMIITIIIGIGIGTLPAWLQIPPRLFWLIQLTPALPFTAVLAYAVLRARLFEPTQAALDLALQSMSDVVAVLDRTGQVIYVNPPASRLGMRTGRALASVLRDAGVDAEVTGALIDQQATWPDPHVAYKIALGAPARLIEVTLAPVADAGILHGALLMGRDITERERHSAQLDIERARLAEAVQQLSHLAGHDALTGLPNRRSLEEHLGRVISRARRGQPSALLFLDLDNFKLVNDTLGHGVGDQVLITVTQVLSQHLRHGDMLARLGGDEFAVILESTDVDQAQVIAERLRVAIDTYRFTMSGRVFELGLSIGLVEVDGLHNGQTLLAQADIAMYNAKEHGRNRVALYHPTSDNFVQLSEASQWVTRIKDALREDRLVLHFQPVVRCSDGHVEHYEVLLRMLASDGELIPPGAFIPAAERFGFMPQLDRWVVRNAIRALRQHPDILLFVNCSSRSLADETLADFIRAELRECGVAPERIGFEITETAALHDMVRAERLICQIKALGCRFALDDFGVGFTSFAYLRNLPIDSIKIDGSFIRTIDQDTSNLAIVQAMHHLAQALGKSTVAEFVEDEVIARMLRDIGITYAQGYYLGRPGPLRLPGAPADGGSPGSSRPVGLVGGRPASHV